MSDRVLGYREYQPSAPLAPNVECNWTACSGTRGGAPPREILLPDGTTQLLFSFGGAYQRFADPRTGAGVRITGSHLVGLRATGVYIEQEGAEDIFAIRFRAGGLYPFLQIPGTELVQRTIELAVLPTALAGELEGRIFDAATPAERVRVVECVLLGRLREVGGGALYDGVGYDGAWGGPRSGPGGDPNGARVRHAIRRIYASRGTITIDRLGAELGLGYRALDRAFNRQVGIPPKRLARIVRFNHALLLLQRRDGRCGSRVAQEAGYADQAHLIRDFREFVHAPPGEFLARRHGIVEVSRPALERRLSNSFKTDR
jgi:AraC-like DNA-binding protein